MFPLQNLPYEDVLLPFTNDIETVMEQQYGDYMTMPPVEKRKTHYPYRLEFEKGVEAQK